METALKIIHRHCFMQEQFFFYQATTANSVMDSAGCKCEWRPPRLNSNICEWVHA